MKLRAECRVSSRLEKERIEERRRDRGGVPRGRDDELDFKSASVLEDRRPRTACPSGGAGGSADEEPMAVEASMLPEDERRGGEGLRVSLMVIVVASASLPYSGMQE